jgi:hypothetical protein
VIRDIRILAVALILLTALFTSCPVQQAVDAKNQALGALEDAIAQLDDLNGNIEGIRKTLDDTKQRLDQGEYARQVGQLAGDVSLIGESSVKGTFEFLRDEVKRDLTNLIRSIQGKPPLAATPKLARVTYPDIDFTSPSRTTVKLVGSHLRGVLDDPSYTFVIRNRDREERDIDRRFLSIQGSFVILIDVSSSGVSLRYHDAKIVVRGFPGEMEIPIIRTDPPPPVLTEEITKLWFHYWTGDEDKDNDGGYVGARVQRNGSVLAEGLTMAPGDENRIWNDDHWNGWFPLDLSTPVPWAKRSEVQVAIGHWRTGGNPAWRFRVEIDATVRRYLRHHDGRQTPQPEARRRVLNQYDPQRHFNHDPGGDKWDAFDLRGRRSVVHQTPFFHLSR